MWNVKNTFTDYVISIVSVMFIGSCAVSSNSDQFLIEKKSVHISYDQALSGVEVDKQAPHTYWLSASLINQKPVAWNFGRLPISGSEHMMRKFRDSAESSDGALIFKTEEYLFK